MSNVVSPDLNRGERIGLDEAILCDSKSDADLVHILDRAIEGDHSLLLTRLSEVSFGRFPVNIRKKIDYDPVSKTGFLGPLRALSDTALVAIVTAGTSDNPVAREASRTLRHAGEPSVSFDDLGVAGLWRILEKESKLHTYPVVIVVAGMDGALFSVIGGLVPSTIIAVPTSVGYGAARRGEGRERRRAEGRPHGVRGATSLGRKQSVRSSWSTVGRSAGCTTGVNSRCEQRGVNREV